MRINIKPLSVNNAWQGRRFKTPTYKKYETELLFVLPQLKVPKTMLKIVYRFGFSSKLADLANPEKLVTDILCKKYGFNDNQIYEMQLFKEIVPKGAEFIEFEITEI
jgi:hypothetical protein